ncbi:MAG: peptidylprolyl isomerase, partial [Chitinophagaceae bacterium]|nr:peptidylprolyl isomerase [Chitinophagaceae bacterium]
MRIVLILLLSVCLQVQAQVPKETLLKRKAPESFQVLFTTTKGYFILEAYRRWSPIGVDRLYQLVISGFYNNNSIYRVEPNYVVQFGISDQFELNFFWDSKKIIDEPVLYQHKKGIVAFARDVANSRSTQLFINMVDNPTLDTTMRSGVKGFSPIGKILKGMDVLTKLNAQYGRRITPIQDSIYLYGNAYLQENFPGLDYIIS